MPHYLESRSTRRHVERAAVVKLNQIPESVVLSISATFYDAESVIAAILSQSSRLTAKKLQDRLILK